MSSTIEVSELEDVQLPSENQLAPVVKLEQGLVWQKDRQALNQGIGKEGQMLRDPSEKQLCEVIIMIKDRLPSCNIAKVIELLHDTLIKEERPCFLLGQDDFYNDDEPQIEKRKMQMQYARKFQDSESDPRFYEQREIAKLFCLKGYGYPTARQYLGQTITPNRYNNVITTIVRLAYRKLEGFITKHLNPDLSIIGREELKMIKTPLVNCRNWMTDIQAQNFHRFVRLTYKLNTQDPQLEVALNLHEAIMNQLKKRSITYKHQNRRGEEYSGWTEEMEKRLVLHYAQNPELLAIQAELTSQYPQHRACFAALKLRIKIDKMVRVAVRKLVSERQKFGFNSVININDYTTNKIVRSPSAALVRRFMLSYYLDRNTNAVKLREVDKVVRDYLNASRNQVDEIQDSSCEMVLKEEQAVKLSPEENCLQQRKKQQEQR